MIVSYWTVPYYRWFEMRARLRLEVNVKLANISEMSSVLDWRGGCLEWAPTGCGKKGVKQTKSQHVSIFKGKRLLCRGPV